MAHKGEKSNGSHYTSTRRSRKQVKKNMKRLTVESMKHKPKIKPKIKPKTKKTVNLQEEEWIEGTHRYATPMDNKKRKYKGKYSSKKGTDSQWVIFN